MMKVTIIFPKYAKDDENNTFGKIVKGKYRPRFDFRFDLHMKCLASNSASTGLHHPPVPWSAGDAWRCRHFYLQVSTLAYTYRGNIVYVLHRESYFTTNSVHRKTEFMQIINSSCSESGFTCSFTDKELAEFIQFKKRKDYAVPTKKVVAVVGLQPGGDVWVLGKNICIHAHTGDLINPSECDYQWIGHLFKGPGVAPDSTALLVQLPLTSDHIMPLSDAMRGIMKHNFLQGLLSLGASCMVFHYSTILKHNLRCPVPLLCGGVGTGKSLALRFVLSLYAAHIHGVFSRGTKESIYGIFLVLQSQLVLTTPWVTSPLENS